MRSRTGRPSARARFLRSPRPREPLHGLEVQFQHHAYDWNDTAPLARLLADLAARGAIIAASSEGGLFEYGTDDAIVANLTALARAGVPIVAGSVTSSSEVRKRMIAQARFGFLRAAWKASHRSPSGAAMRSPRAAPPS